MSITRIRLSKLTAALALLALLATSIAPRAGAWSNGSFSEDPREPVYGTHDYLAEHALAWLPEHEKMYILNNKPEYLYGTELPDLSPLEGGIGDYHLHHVYFDENGYCTDSSAADRAQDEYAHALRYLREGKDPLAARHAGLLAHYLTDLAVFGHVMSERTVWGEEEHHWDYERMVLAYTNDYEDDFFALTFDGSLDESTAYKACIELARNTTFGWGQGYLGCRWMDENYDWNNTVWVARVRESLELACNLLADVLHTLARDAERLGPIKRDARRPFLSFPVFPVVLALFFAALCLKKSRRE